MGESQEEALRVGFDGRLKLESHRANVNSEAGWVCAEPPRRRRIGIRGAGWPGQNAPKCPVSSTPVGLFA